MQHCILPSGTLIVTSTSRLSDWLLLGSAALCTLPTLRGAFHGSFNLHDSTPLIGSALFLFGFLVSFERARFEFDPRWGVIRWSRQRSLTTGGGILPFARVQSVVLQSSLGSKESNPSYRVALISDQGELPLTISYSGGDRAPYEATADHIRTLMGLTPSSSDHSPDQLPENVLAAMDQGRKLEAIRLVRLHKGLSLSEAKRFVEQWPHVPRSSNS